MSSPALCGWAPSLSPVHPLPSAPSPRLCWDEPRSTSYTVVVGSPLQDGTSTTFTDPRGWTVPSDLFAVSAPRVGGSGTSPRFSGSLPSTGPTGRTGGVSTVVRTTDVPGSRVLPYRVTRPPTRDATLETTPRSHSDRGHRTR